MLWHQIDKFFHHRPFIFRHKLEVDPGAIALAFVWGTIWLSLYRPPLFKKPCYGGRDCQCDPDLERRRFRADPLQ